MPRANNKYRFEWTILEWAWAVSKTFTGDAHYPYIIVFNSDGVVQRFSFGMEPEVHDAAEWKAMRDGAEAWFCYDPFEGPEYTYISWYGVAQQSLERLVGRTITAEDLTTGGETILFPTEWGVMS